MLWRHDIRKDNSFSAHGTAVLSVFSSKDERRFQSNQLLMIFLSCTKINGLWFGRCIYIYIYIYIYSIARRVDISKGLTGNWKSFELRHQILWWSKPISISWKVYFIALAKGGRKYLSLPRVHLSRNYRQLSRHVSRRILSFRSPRTQYICYCSFFFHPNFTPES